MSRGLGDVYKRQGYGFDLKIAKITGTIAFVGSFVLTILFYILGRNFF